LITLGTVHHSPASVPSPVPCEIAGGVIAGLGVTSIVVGGVLMATSRHPAVVDSVPRVAIAPRNDGGLSISARWSF
jgi:hypothetical protein